MHITHLALIALTAGVVAVPFAAPASRVNNALATRNGVISTDLIIQEPERHLRKRTTTPDPGERPPQRRSTLSDIELIESLDDDEMNWLDTSLAAKRTHWRITGNRETPSPELEAQWNYEILDELRERLRVDEDFGGTNPSSNSFSLLPASGPGRDSSRKNNVPTPTRPGPLEWVRNSMPTKQELMNTVQRSSFFGSNRVPPARRWRLPIRRGI